MSTFTYKSHEIFYTIDGDITGDKDIMIILNGIMMSTKSWEEFVPAFSQHHTLIRFDMIDQGQSSKVDFDYTQALQVEVLDALLDHLDISLVSLVGISYGASVALQYAIKYPNNIQKLILANVVAKTSQWLKAIGHGWNQVAKTRDGEAYYNITIPYIYSAQFYDKNIDWMENRKQTLIPIFSDPDFLDAMTRLTNSAETHDTRDALNDLSVDTLIISGDQDYLTPVFEQQDLATSLPHSHHVIIPNCGHASMYEQPQLFRDLVLGFINDTKVPKII